MLLAVPVVLVSLYGYAAWRNNTDMEAWRSEIYAASELEDAELLERGSRFGLQPGTNGNHCDREAWLVFRTNISAKEVKAHFDAIEWSSSSDLDQTSWRVTSEPGPDLVRVDFDYRFEPGRDVRCM